MRPPNVRRRLELRLHGYPALAIDGVDAPLKLKRGLALLALLAESGRKLSRARVAALLWPDAAEALGRSRLRRLVHEVHTSLGADPVAGDTDALWLDDARWHCTSDVQRVRDAARAALADADADVGTLLAPDAGSLLDGFEPPSDAYAEWLEPQRAEQRRLACRALQHVAERQAADGDAALAREAAERLIALEPLSEAGHAALLGALGRRGDVAALDAAYFRCAELVRREFGVAPSPAVEAAYASALARARGDAVPAPPAPPPIRFAHTAEGAVAYSVHGDAGPAIVVVPGLLSHVEVALDEPRVRRCIERLAARHRVVLVDRRGTGLSERVGIAPTAAAAVDDIVAVADGLGDARVWLFGASVGGALAIEVAASRPERVAGLVLYGTSARGAWAPDYPWAMKPDQLQRWLSMLQAGWGGATSVEAFAPSAAGDPQVRAWWARLLRSAASPQGIAGILRAFHDTDVRDRLPALRVPTLVIQRDDDRIVRAAAGRYLAERIAGARFLRLPGADHWWWHGDADAVLQAIESFIAGR